MFSDGTFSDGTFLEWDVSKAGPFVCAPLYFYETYVQHMKDNVHLINMFYFEDAQL